MERLFADRAESYPVAILDLGEAYPPSPEEEEAFLEETHQSLATFIDRLPER